MSLLPNPDSSDEGVYHIYAMRYANNANRVARQNFLGEVADAHDSPMPINYFVWIVKNKFRTLLMDTGFGARAAKERNRILTFDPIDALPKVGINPDELEDVFLTHLHYDHAGNLGRFAKAKIHVQEAEAAYATGRCMCEPGLRFAFDVHDIVDLMKTLYADRVVFHNDKDTPFPGIKLHVLPGHSMGMQAIHVMTPRGLVLLASDVSHYYANFIRRDPFSITIDSMATYRSYTELMKIGGSVDRIIPGHDPKVRMIYPLQTFGGIEFAALHEEPKPHTIEFLTRLDNFPVT